MKTHNYYFEGEDPVDGVFIIRVSANRRPSEKSIPKTGTWRVEELDKENGWQIPCFPEITWGTLKKMNYIGKTLVENNDGN